MAEEKKIEEETELVNVEETGEIKAEEEKIEKTQAEEAEEKVEEEVKVEEAEELKEEKPKKIKTSETLLVSEGAQKSKKCNKISDKKKEKQITNRKEEKEENVEAENAREEIKEIVEKCVRCGLCKSLCPVFRILREETISPRGKAILLDNNIYDKIIFECSLCKACEEKCPLGLKLCTAFKKARLVLCEEGKETEENKEMIKHIREDGNPFGKEIKKTGKLYCC